MEVRLITDAGATQFPPAALLQREEGMVRVDIPQPDHEACRILAEAPGTPLWGT